MQGQNHVSESKWTGSVLGLLGTMIVAELLSVFTLFIGTPWAITFVVRYVEEHMTVSGHRLSFDGTGGQLLGNWIKWLLLTIVTIGIYSFWIPNNVFKWVTKHTKIDA